MSYTENQVKEMLEAIAKINSETRGKLENRIDGVSRDYDDLKKQLDAIETAVARGGLPGGGSSAAGFGRGIDAQAARDHKEAFLAWARKGGNESALRALEIKAGMSTDSDPDGGMLVAEEMEKNIERVASDALAMRRLARIVKSKGEYTKPISRGGAGGGWVSERGTRDETDSPELSLFAPKMGEMYALPEVTQKLLDMSEFDVAAWLEEEINITLLEVEGTAFITGNGVEKSKGIIDAALMIADASWEYGKTGFITSGHASLLNNVDKLKTLKRSLKPVYRRNGIWLMNDTTAEVISKFKDGEGRYIWSDGLTKDDPDTLLGRPVEIDDNMPDIGANTYPIAFADWQRAYTICDHVSGIRLLRDPFTKKGYVKFYVTKRVTGGISNYEAIKFMKIAA